MYWTGRYFERAQALARVVSGYERLSLDAPAGESQALSPLLALVGREPSAVGPQAASESMRALVLDAENPSSVRGALGSARENLRSGRTVMPDAVWAPVNRLYARLGEIAPEHAAGVLLALEEVGIAGSLVEGQLASSMTRDAAYSFWSIGCRVERADMLLRTLALLVPRLAESEARRFADVRWIGLLECLGAGSMYRRRHQTHLDLPALLDFVIHDATFPRSVRYLVASIEHELNGLPRSGPARALLATRELTFRAEARALAEQCAQFAARLTARLQAFNQVFAEIYFPAAREKEESSLTPASVGCGFDGTTHCSSAHGALSQLSA